MGSSKFAANGKTRLSDTERINLYKLVIARNDITEALLTTELFLKTVSSISSPYFQPLQDAIVIAYARPFTGNAPYGALAKKWSVFSDVAMESTHEMLIHTRMKLVAHSDMTYRRVVIMPKGTSMLPGETQPNEDVVLRVSTKKIALTTFPLIRNLCLDLGSRLDDEVEKITDAFISDENFPKAPFDLLDGVDLPK